MTGKPLSVLRAECEDATRQLKAAAAVLGRAVENLSKAWLDGRPAAALEAALDRAKAAVARARAHSDKAFAAYEAAAKASMKKPCVAMAAR